MSTATSPRVLSMLWRKPSMSMVLSTPTVALTPIFIWLLQSSIYWETLLAMAMAMAMVLTIPIQIN